MNPSATNTDIQKNLGLRPKKTRPLLRLFSSVVILSLIGVAAWFAWPMLKPVEKAPSYRTEEARTGDLVVKVSATGNLEPTNQVDVGSELSGMIEAVLVDDNASVTQGQAIARLAPSRVRDQVNTSKAALASIGLMFAVLFWNDYTNYKLYITNDRLYNKR